MPWIPNAALVAVAREALLLVTAMPVSYVATSLLLLLAHRTWP